MHSGIENLPNFTSDHSEPSQQELFDTAEFHVEPVLKYKILVGHNLEDGTFKTQEQLLEQYLSLTDKLIGKIDGSSGEGPPYEAVIYLDKSARPISWMVSELWDDLARIPNTKFEDKIIPKKPATFFLNIDREQWLPVVDPGHTGNYNIDAIPQETIDGLRAIYQPYPNRSDTILDGKRILIVDEVRVTGSTLTIAQAVLKRAIPNAEFGTAHWMIPKIVSGKDGVKRNNDVPVWYKKHDPTGRGVGDRDLNLSTSSSSRAQRLGKWFLSTPLGFIDNNSVQLRAEIKKMAQAMRDGTILFTSSADRDVDDSISRNTSINNISFEDFKTIKSTRE